MSWANRTSKIAIGDKVCFKASYMRDRGMYTGDEPLMRGEVKAIKTIGSNVLVTVDWGNDYTSKVLAVALSKVTTRGIADE